MHIAVITITFSDIVRRDAFNIDNNIRTFTYFEAVEKKDDYATEKRLKATILADALKQYPNGEGHVVTVLYVPQDVTDRYEKATLEKYMNMGLKL